MNFLYFINNNLKKIKNKFYIIFFLLIQYFGKFLPKN